MAGASAQDLTSPRRRRALWATPVAAAVAGTVALGATLGLAGCARACETSKMVKVQGALLADAMGYIEEPEGGETIALLPDAEAIDVPAADRVVLAIDRRVPWGRVKEVVDEIEGEGAEAAILVSRRSRVRGFVLQDQHEKRAGVELLGFPSEEGWKSCVRPRGGDKAKCAHQHGGRSIDASYTREIVREAVRAYRSHDVVVGIPTTLPWGDAVRLIDAARTCCLNEDESIRIEITTLDERGAPQKDD